MSNGSVDSQKTKAMSPRIAKDLVIAALLALLPIALVAALIVSSNSRDQEFRSIASAESSAVTGSPTDAGEPGGLVERTAADFDYEAAAELWTLRWEAMAEFYEANGMLTDGAPLTNVIRGQFTVAPTLIDARATIEALPVQFTVAPSLIDARATIEALPAQASDRALDSAPPGLFMVAPTLMDARATVEALPAYLSETDQ